jgi:hypothetical protein
MARTLRFWRPRQGSLALVFWSAVICLIIANPNVAAASEFSWGSPTMVEHEAPYSGYKITGYSCPNASFCVAVNSGGDVSVSTDPTGGASKWSTSHVDNAEGGLTEATAEFTGISCPSTELCVASDSVGNIWVSKDPGGGETAWTNSAKPAYSLQGVSCSSTALCVAVGGDGYVYETTEPTAGASAWHESWVDEFRRLETISCVSGLCLAADESGKIFTSTEPTAGLAAWHEAHIDTATYPELHATCVSAILCVVADWSGNVLTSTNPTGGASAWKSAHVSTAQYAYPFFAVACGSETACIAATDTGEIYASTNPTGSASAWKLQTVAAEGFLNSAVCVGSTLCLAGDSGGNNWASTNPVAASPSWSSANVDGVDTLAGVSCAPPSASLCVAVDARGRILSSADLEAGAPGWTSRTVPGVTQLSGVSCPSTSLCVASADNGVVASSNPTGPASAWSFARVDSLNLVEGVSCPTSSLCVGFDGFGNVFHSVDPAGGTSAWSEPEDLPEAGPSNGLSSLSCASETLCVAVTYGGVVYTTTDPTGHASAWTKTELGIGDQFLSISCPTASLCVGVGESAIIYSTDPTGGASAWHKEELTGLAIGKELLRGVSCASTALCVVWDNYGQVYASTEPGASASTWTRSTAEPRRYAPSGLSCVTPGICLLVDQRGDVVIGKPQSESETKKKEAEAKKKAEEEETARKAGSGSGGGSTAGNSNSGGTGISSVLGTTAKVLSTAEIATLLRAVPTPTGKAAALKTVLKAGGYALAFAAPAAGKLVVSWYEVPKGAHLAKAKLKPILVASVGASFASAQSLTLKLKLTPTGRKLLEAAKRVALVEQSTFTPTGGTTVATTKTFALHR